MSTNLNEICEKLSSLTVLELSELSKALELKWGVSAASQVVSVSSSPVAVASPVEEKDKFGVLLKEIGVNKINVIKEVRAITGLGLTEAKAAVEAAPKLIKEDLSKSEAEEIKKKLEAVGAKVDLT